MNSSIYEIEKKTILSKRYNMKKDKKKAIDFVDSSYLAYVL